MGNGALTSPLNAQTAKTLAGDQFDAAFFSETANDDGTLPPDIATKWASEHHVTPTSYAIHSLSKEENKTFHPTNPTCSNGHNMVLSDFAGAQGNYTNGYCCDYCGLTSVQGICGGGRTRWFCQECNADVCFDCYPCIPRCASNHVMVLSAHEYPTAPGMGWGCDLCRQNPKEPGHVGPMERWHCFDCSSDFCLDCRPTPRRVGKPTSANDLAAIVRTSVAPPSGISVEHHRLVGSWMMAGNPVVVPLDAVAKRLVYLALKHKVKTQAELQAMMALYGNSLPSMLFLIAHSCKDVLEQWCLAFLSDFAAHPEKVRPLLPVFKFILADPNFVAFGLGSHTKGTTNPNFEIMKLTPDTAFIPKCHGICARELDKIGVAGERMCAERGFVAALASVGQELQEIHGVRLDQVSVPVYPREYTFADPPSRIHLDEFTFINTPLLVHLHSFTFTNTHPFFAAFSLPPSFFVQIVGDNELWLALESQMNTQKSLDMQFDAGTEFCRLLELLNKVTEAMFAAIVQPVVETCGGTWTHDLL